MKRKFTKCIAVTVLCAALTASCALEEDLTPPNPGFGIITTGKDLSGRDYFVRGADVSGRLATTFMTGESIIPSGATGTVREFNVTTNFRSRAIVPGGIAKAAWIVTGGIHYFFPVPGFLGPRDVSCWGKTGIAEMNPGQWTTLTCQEIPAGAGIGGPLPFGRSSINVSEPGIEFEMGANRVTSTYGMPTFQFYDPFGTFVAQTTATAIDTEDGIWARGWSHCLAGLPTGTYRIELINATPDGIGECVNISNVHLYGASTANYIDDHQFFVAQQYRDFLNREPDSGGLNYWTGQITQCGNVTFREPNETYAQCVVRKRRDVSFAFWSSMEFQQLRPEVVNPSGSPPYNNSQFARLSHVLYLQREPTQAEQDFWTANLDATNNYGPIISAFINSDEYRLRFEPPPPPVCNPTWEELNICQQQGGWWDYAGCWCNYGGPMY